MPKLPAISLYTGDWLKDPNLSKCSAATRGIWIDALCAMHESDRSGILEGTPDQLSRCLRCSPSEVLAAARELDSTGTANVTDRNGVVTLINRRMYREHKERAQANLRQRKARGQPLVTPESRVCHDNVTAPISSSSSISSSEKEGLPADAGPAPPVERRKPTGPHAEFIAYFVERWQQEFGESYAFKGAKDGSAARDILKACGGDLDRAKQLVDAFLADTEKFVVDSGHTLAILNNQINRYRGMHGYSPEAQARRVAQRMKERDNGVHRT